VSAPVRWGLVGLGGFAEKNVVPAIAASARSKLVACSGRSLEKSKQFAARLGIPRVYATHDELVLDGEVDAVYVATPNTLHDPVVLAAARAKKHVLCEKPMTMSVPAARQMADACRTAGVVLKLGFHLRFEEIVGRVRELIAAGTIGEVRAIAIERTAATDQPGAWRQKPAEGGGVLYDVGVHLLDTVQWISGARITEVFARSHPDAREGKANDSVAISALLGSGCHASVRASREVPYARNDLVVQGSLGMIGTSSLRWVDEYVLTVTTAAGVREERFAATPAYTREIEAFERAIAGDSTHLATDEDGIAMVAVTTAILKSLESRCSVTV
jgi:1,5-anhydro-D-fructose reductase (1,5-anhydro-D-mannitol-forming)